MKFEKSVVGFLQMRACKIRIEYVIGQNGRGRSRSVHHLGWAETVFEGRSSPPVEWTKMIGRRNEEERAFVPSILQQSPFSFMNQFLQDDRMNVHLPVGSLDIMFAGLLHDE
ncbi:hypothetical protein SDJN03_07122, partial [Cucurbita argyrosperma subsp. sororia]